MKKVAISSKRIISPFGNYSHAIFNKTTGFLLTSGQLGIDRNGHIPSSLVEQARLCFLNISELIDEAGFSISDILKVSGFVTKRKYFADYMRIRDEFFQGVEVKPASTLVVVRGFTKAKFMVEVEVIAQK